MRRFAISFLLAALAAAALTAGASAKEGGLELSSAPFGTKPGEPWTPRLILIEGAPELLAQARPGVTIRSLASGETIDFRARATGKPGVYDLRVVFPHEGRWTVEAYDGVTGSSYDFFGPVRIVGPGPVAAVPPAAPPRGSFPVLPLLGGLALLCAALGGAAFLVARARRALPQ
jgi:hypothetical protein